MSYESYQQMMGFLKGTEGERKAKMKEKGIRHHPFKWGEGSYASMYTVKAKPFHVNWYSWSGNDKPLMEWLANEHKVQITNENHSGNGHCQAQLEPLDEKEVCDGAQAKD